jgi:hypothetical protein
MDHPAIYLLSRKVEGDDGEIFFQNVTVYARSSEHALALVNDQFDRLLKVSSAEERAYHRTPPFKVEKIKLDDYQMISAGITK